MVTSAVLYIAAQRMRVRTAAETAEIMRVRFFMTRKIMRCHAGMGSMSASANAERAMAAIFMIRSVVMGQTPDAPLAAGGYVCYNEKKSGGRVCTTSFCLILTER